MAYKPNEDVPLMLFGLFVAPISVAGLMHVGTTFSYELAAVTTMLVGALLVIGLVQHWRHA